jgi:hypothetical protein
MLNGVAITPFSEFVPPRYKCYLMYETKKYEVHVASSVESFIQNI